MALRSLVFALLFLFAPALAVAAPATLSSAESLIAGGKDLAAISMLKRVVEEKPDDYQAWFLLGVTQARKRHFDDAIEAFRHVSKLQPELAEPHNNLAVVYNEMGNLRGAVRELDASLKLNPDYVTAHENIGDLYVKLAARSYKKALSKQENATLRSRYEKLLHIRSAKQGRSVESESITADENVHDLEAPKEVPAVVQADHSQQALDAIEVWRVAWSDRNLDRYFASYAADFEPGAGFKSQEEWKSYKQSVIAKRKFINVTINNIVVSEMADGQMKAVFLQGFRSDSFQSDDRKELILKKNGHNWKITHESSNK